MPLLALLLVGNVMATGTVLGAKPKVDLALNRHHLGLRLLSTKVRRHTLEGIELETIALHIIGIKMILTVLRVETKRVPLFLEANLSNGMEHYSTTAIFGHACALGPQ